MWPSLSSLYLHHASASRPPPLYNHQQQSQTKAGRQAAGAGVGVAVLLKSIQVSLSLSLLPRYQNGTLLLLLISSNLQPMRVLPPQRKRELLRLRHFTYLLTSRLLIYSTSTSARPHTPHATHHPPATLGCSVAYLLYSMLQCYIASIRRYSTT